MHDVVGAWTEALLAWGVYTAWVKRCKQSHVPLQYWVLASLALGSLTLWANPKADPVVFVCASAGLLLNALVLQLDAALTSQRHAAALGIFMTLGFVGIKWWTAWAMPTEASFAACHPRGCSARSLNAVCLRADETSRDYNGPCNLNYFVGCCEHTGGTLTGDTCIHEF